VTSEAQTFPVSMPSAKPSRKRKTGSKRRPSHSSRFLLLSKEASACAYQSPILRLNTVSAPDSSRASLVRRDENIARTNLFSRNLLP
jgi:hypothetical protein